VLFERLEQVLEFEVVGDDEFVADFAGHMANRAERRADPRLWDREEPADVDDDPPPFVFGGYSLAFALVVGASSVRGELGPWSLHAKFLREGVGSEPVRVSLERVTDGRRSARRTVRLLQKDRVFFAADVNFQALEDSGGWQRSPKAVPAPTELDTAIMGFPAPVMEVRPVAGPDSDMLKEVIFPFWARFPNGVPGGSGWSPAAQAWGSDYGTAVGMLHQSGRSLADGIARTVEHSMWFHRPLDPANWFLVDNEPIALGEKQLLSLGTIHDETGMHAASFAQAAVVITGSSASS
jgi:acyl-CoA thioesterase II